VLTRDARALDNEVQFLWCEMGLYRTFYVKLRVKRDMIPQ